MGKKVSERIEMSGKFVQGWADFRPGYRVRRKDDKGRLLGIEERPPRIVTRLLVELEDGNCVPVVGEHFDTLESASIKIPIKSVFPARFEKAVKIATTAYKPGAKVKLKRITFADTGNHEYFEKS